MLKYSEGTQRPVSKGERFKIPRGDTNAGEMMFERRWVLLKIPRCDIDGVGEGKWP